MKRHRLSRAHLPARLRGLYPSREGYRPRRRLGPIRLDEVEALVDHFLLDVIGLSRGFYANVVEDGDGWAFWIREEDTTSYVHSNLLIEWCGTGWVPRNYAAPTLSGARRAA